MKKLLFILILFCSVQGFGQIKGYWRFNGNSNDASGNGNNGTDQNVSYSQSYGRLNQGLKMNATTSKVATAYRKNTTQSTFSFWLKTTLLTSNQCIMGQRYDTGGYENSFWWITLIRSNHSTFPNKILFDQKISSTVGNSFASNSQIQSNLWTYVVITVNINDFKLYINSKLDASYTSSFNPVITSCPHFIGNTGDLDSYFQGSIDELIIDNTVWPPSRVKNEYIRMLGAFSN